MQNIYASILMSLLVILHIMFFGCKDEIRTEPADLILYNAFIYPVEGDPIENGAIVIRDGKIISIGAVDTLLKAWESRTKEKRDCQGAFLMPGFIEGHGHFSGLGYNLIQLDLLETRNWQDIVDSVEAKAKTLQPGEWITGRGWHQEKWLTPVTENVNGYPYHTLLSKVSPLNPVMLIHASGHSLFANEAAMKSADVTLETPDPVGGRIVRDEAGVAVGVFEENAMDLIRKSYKDYQAGLSAEDKKNEWYDAIAKAQQHCLEHGITTFQDAGSSFTDIERYHSLATHDSLDLRLWVMLRQSSDELKGHLDGFPILGSDYSMFTCRAIKAQMDGALGSFGAWLLEPYSDKPGFTGQNTTPVEEIQNLASIAMENGMQMCIHAIGDRGNREVLNVYENEMKAHPEKKDLRWRIEHVQHLHPDDMVRFKQLGVIASMQAIHCTSDAPFVVKRLGEKRAREGAYAWRKLLDLGVVIANGTDTPVERVDPLSNLYASITRQRLDNGMVFFEQQAMTREEALYSYTLANAYAAFEDEWKGSLVPGKSADIVILSHNLLTCPEDSIPQAKVLITMVGGEIKYQANR